MAKCSTTGPSANEGKNVRPPTIRIVPTRSPTNSGPSVGKVPEDGGTIFLPASDPAAANMGTIIRKRPISMAKPSVEL